MKTIALVLCCALGGVSGVAVAQVDPTLPNLVPMFPDVSRIANNFVITNRLGQPTIEFEILTSNIGGQDWIRPPIRRDVTCTGSGQSYFRMPQTHEYTVYWFDPALGDYVMVDQRRKTTICIQDDYSRGRDPQNFCLAEYSDPPVRFPCGCNSPYYGPGRGNGVSMGWSDSYFRGLAGQWAAVGSNTGDFLLTTELDPDQLLQADDLLPEETDATHADNISYVYFGWDGVGVACGLSRCPTYVETQYSFDPVCPL
jgi:hypothetical protein